MVYEWLVLLLFSDANLNVEFCDFFPLENMRELKRGKRGKSGIHERQCQKKLDWLWNTHGFANTKMYSVQAIQQDHG